MKFKIKSQLLLSNIKKIVKITPYNLINEIYKNMKVEVKKDKIYFYILNDKIFLKFYLLTNQKNLEINETGTFLINFKILYEILNKLDDEWILFEIQINTLTISNSDKYNNFILKLNTLDINNFPEISFEKNNQPIQLSKSIIEDINNQINFAVSTNNKDLVLRGINFNFSKNNLLNTGTDGISMAQKNIIIKNEDFEKEVTIPTFLLNDIAKVANDLNNDYYFYLNDDKSLIIEIDNFLFKGRLIDGQYPTSIQSFIQKRLSTKNQEIVEINDLKMFLNTIDLSIILSQKELIPYVNLTFDKINQKIEVICENNNNSFGKVHEQFNNVKFISKKEDKTIFNITFNYYLLMYALKTFSKCKKIRLNIMDNYHTIITSDEDLTLFQLVLPIVKN